MKTVFITGTSSGIGKATAMEFANNNWQVIATSRKRPKDDAFNNHANITFYHLDVTNTKQISETVTKVISKYKHIDVLVNNAGYGTLGPFETSTPKQIQSLFDVNVFGLMNVTREVIPYMRKKKNGTIINISSMGGRLTFPLYNAYHASKWAVDGFSESLMFELEQFGIKLKIIEPGAIKTDFYGSSESRFSDHKAYSSFQKRVEKIFDSASNNGTKPDKVAKTVYKSAVDSSNKLRYVVGAPAPVLLTARKLLPERIYLWLVKKQLK